MYHTKCNVKYILSCLVLKDLNQKKKKIIIYQ